MKIIDRKNYFATVCEVYAMLSIGKILLEAFTHYKWGIDQMNFIFMFVVSLAATFVLSQHYRLDRFPLPLVILGQYLVILGAIMLFLWIYGHFGVLGKHAYRDMFLSFTIPYIILAGLYYMSLFREIKKANKILEELRTDNDEKKDD